MKNILIVDDDPFITELYHEKFQAAGFAVEVATSGGRAVQMLGEHAPDVMLLDLSLGDMTGVEVLEIARANPATRDMPVVVLCSAHMGDLLQAARRAGSSRCLNKGLCAPDRVVAEVCAVLRRGASPRLAELVDRKPDTDAFEQKRRETETNQKVLQQKMEMEWLKRKDGPVARAIASPED